MRCLVPYLERNSALCLVLCLSRFIMMLSSDIDMTAFTQCSATMETPSRTDQWCCWTSNNYFCVSFPFCYGNVWSKLRQLFRCFLAHFALLLLVPRLKFLKDIHDMFSNLDWNSRCSPKPPNAHISLHNGIKMFTLWNFINVSNRRNIALQSCIADLEMLGWYSTHSHFSQSYSPIYHRFRNNRASKRVKRFQP